MATKYPHSKYPKTCALLEKHGIDPATVLTSTVSEAGYDEPCLDEDGDRMYDAKNRLITERRTWPSTLSGKSVMAVYDTEGFYE